VGCRGIKTLEKLWERLKLRKIQVFCADRWRAYNAVIPPDRLVQSKAETYTAEQTWSDLRHWLARFKRRGKVVSRSLKDLIHAIAMHFNEVNLRYG
jgi:insertion element IS1 protein InsB